MQARCQCGLTSIDIPHNKPIAYVICHCNKCRLETGSVFRIGAMFPYFDFSNASLSTASTPASDRGTVNRSHFCRGCGDKILSTVGPDQVQEIVSFHAVRLVDVDVRDVVQSKETLHLWTKEAMVPNAMWEGCHTWEMQPGREEIEKVLLSSTGP